MVELMATLAVEGSLFSEIPDMPEVFLQAFNVDT
jgi:hypothetical protein